MSMVDRGQPRFFFLGLYKTHFSSPVTNLRKSIEGRGTELICTSNNSIYNIFDFDEEKIFYIRVKVATFYV